MADISEDKMFHPHVDIKGIHSGYGSINYWLKVAVSFKFVSLFGEIFFSLKQGLLWTSCGQECVGKNLYEEKKKYILDVAEFEIFLINS